MRGRTRLAQSADITSSLRNTDSPFGVLTLPLFVGKLPDSFGLVRMGGLTRFFMGKQKSLFTSHYEQFDGRHFQ
jgi:hypothetical protein